MTQATRDNAIGISDELRRDLALVLPEVRAVGGMKRAEAQAWVGGRAASVEDAVTYAAELLRGSAAPAIVGLNGLTLEAVREAVALAEAARARLLPMPLGDPLSMRMSVTQAATLGHAMSADLRVVIQDGARKANAIEALIAERVPNALFMPGDLGALLQLRATVREQGAAAITSTTALPVKHVVIPLPADTDPRVIGQWHRLAADLQRAVRVSAITVPDLTKVANLRGALEVITWQTGLSCATGGVDFADGAPRPSAAAATLIQRGGIDLAVDTGWRPLPVELASQCAHRIRIGIEADASADVSFVTPGLAAGLRARVMRFDGVILWLCDDPAPAAGAVDDPAVSLLRRWIDEVR